MYRGPMVITAIDRPDLVKVRDLIIKRESMVYATFQASQDMPRKEIESLVATDLDEFNVQKYFGYSGTETN